MAKGMMLDCESNESALKSLAELYDVHVDTIKSVLGRIQADNAIAQYSGHDAPFEQVVFSVFNRLIGKNAGVISQVAWFHITRADRYRNSFSSDGIMPLRDNLPAIWDYLYSLVRDEISPADWIAFKGSMESSSSHWANLYRMKVGDKLHWGPFGFLVREISLVPEEVGNYDYFKMPEIVRDICAVFSETRPINLRARYQRATTPCIVKFCQNGGTPDLIVRTIYYTFCKIFEMGLSIDASTCFDGGGKRISPEQVLACEYLSEARMIIAK